MDLQVSNVRAGYGALEVLHGVDLEVTSGSIATLVGVNGAGKTTLLRAICGLCDLSMGSVNLGGKDIRDVAPHEMVRCGAAHVPEGREIFPGLTVLENLKLGAYGRPGGFELSLLDEVYSLFPVLRERTNQAAGSLSGGQQQMLAIGRALMCEPKFLMLDEPSLGLAPKVVAELFAVISSLRERGLTVLLVEQNAQQALEVADIGFVLEAGEVIANGPADQLLSDERIRASYLGG